METIHNFNQSPKGYEFFGQALAQALPQPIALLILICDI